MSPAWRMRGPAQRGFTLVEIMVAMAISMIMLTALVTLLVNNSRAHAELDRSSRQIENGRYAMDTLANELSLAGYYGELTQTGAAFVTADPCTTNIAAFGFASAPFTVPVPLQGFAGTAADPVPGCAPDHRAATAALVVRRLDTVSAAPGAIAANNAYLQTSRCQDDLASMPFVLSSNSADFTLRTLDCGATQNVRRYVTRIYYVADCDVCGVDTIPTLKRVEFRDGAMTVTPLAEGVEELQLEYGFDLDGNGSPDEFRTGLSGVGGAANNDWRNVMAVRMWLISRTTEPTGGYADGKIYHLGTLGDRGPYNDAFKRSAYSQFVRLVNPAGLRE